MKPELCVRGDVAIGGLRTTPGGTRQTSAVHHCTGVTVGDEREGREKAPGAASEHMHAMMARP